MADERIRRLVDAMLREASVSNEHKRLQADLDAWAAALNYPIVYKTLPNGREPDVLRYHAESKMAFIGDAKNAENETPMNSETVQRIGSYIQEFATLLRGPNVRGGIVAIATNEETAAHDWITTLNVLCIRSGINGGPDHSPPNFTVQQLQGKQTWVTWW